MSFVSSSSSGEIRDPNQERHSMDLASSKGTTMKPSESGRPNPSSQLSQIRGIATAVGHTQTRVLNSGIQTIASMPLSTGAGGTQGLTTLKQVSVPRAGIAVTSTASSTVSLTQGIATLPARPTLAVSHISTTYHVPRGAAAVANIAAPRSAVATPIVRATSGINTAPHASSFVSGLRGLTSGPLAPRAPSPATSGTTWLSSPVSQPSTIPTAVSPRPRPNTITTLPAYTQGRPNSMTVTARPITPQGSRLQNEPARPQLLHASAQKTITGTQLHIAENNFFKPGVSVQSALGGVSIAQVLPTRTQAPLAYSSPTTVAATAHFSTTCSQGTAALISTQPHQLTLAPGAARLAMSSQGAVLTAAQRPATAVLSPPTRLSTPARLATTSQTRIATAGQGITTLARLSVATAGTAASTQARLAVAGNGTIAGQQAVAAQPRLTVSAAPSSGATRLTVSSGAQTQQQVLATQARLAVPMSLHPVVVSSALPLKPTGTRTITAHQTLGPKVIAQPVHGPSIQITQVPVSAVSSVAGKISQGLQQAALTITTGTARTVTYTATTTVAGTTVSGLRPVTVATSPAIPVAKVFPQAPPVSEVAQPSSQATSVYIQTSHRASPAPASNQVTMERAAPMVSTYSLPTAYYYEPPMARPYAPASPFTIQTTVAAPVPALRPGLATHQVHGTLAPTEPPAPSLSSQQPPVKPNASPRPSILRKRDNEGSPLKAAKNLMPVLASLGAPPASPPSPRRPDSRGNGGNSSGGSTTISATSSPGLGEGGEDSLPPVKQEPVDESEKPPVEMSPRKKPRKQQLTGNELHEPKFSEDEMEFISEEKIKKEIKEVPEELEKAFVPKKPTVSLINSYRHTWKSRHNHYQRYSDIKPKDERRPTVTDLASQKQVLQKLNGWKIHHLSTQMEDLSELETHVFEKLTAMLKVMERKTPKDLDKEINRVNELIKGNIQRSKVIRDQMQEAKSQVMKIFDHKAHVTDIIGRCANKRSIKKREKS